MTDLELVRHAKSYIDHLANGVDPISGKELPEDAVLNQPRLIRCFFYVSDILRQVAENGGQISARPEERKQRKVPFDLTMEQRSQVPFSSEPVTITSFVDRLNNLRSDKLNMKKLPTKAVTEWLLEKGFMTIEEVPGRGRQKVPTEMGCRIGLYADRRHSASMGYEYCVTLYNENAQHFIVDNLDNILGR